MFRRRFWVCLALTVPLVVTSEMVMTWFGYHLDTPGIEWVASVLGSAVFAWGGWPLVAAALQEIPRSATGDDVADRHGDHRRLHGINGHEPGLVRTRLLVGARSAGHDHAAGPLAEG